MPSNSEPIFRSGFGDEVGSIGSPATSRWSRRRCRLGRKGPRQLTVDVDLRPAVIEQMELGALEDAAGFGRPGDRAAEAQTHGSG